MAVAEMRRVPLASRSVELRPPSTQLLDRLFVLASTAEVPWAWHERRETPDGFRDSLQAGLLVMHAIVDRRDGTEVGLVRAHDLRPLHRIVSMSTTLLPAYQRRVWPLEGVVLFANHLFVKFGLRRIYGQADAPAFAAIRSGAGRHFEVEGHLREQLLVNGRPTDLHLLTVTDERWGDVGVPLLDRIAPPPRGGPRP